ncbi:MAG: hypothetical protein JNM06_11960, partial [Blastocatellia bacterium]|nr:hypothetical protein [Blastocatellia bacterium]
MKILFLISLFFAFTMVVYSQINDYEKIKSEAEKLYSEGSYSMANQLYQKLADWPLSDTEKRWVNFRLADTLWRSQAATNTSDNTKYEQARQQLEILVRDINREQDRDLVWAEVQESLADFYWQRNNSRSWGQASNYYLAALDWWAGSQNLDLARRRYLKIVFSSAKPTWAETYYYYG